MLARTADPVESRYARLFCCRSARNSPSPVCVLIAIAFCAPTAVAPSSYLPPCSSTRVRNSVRPSRWSLVLMGRPLAPPRLLVKRAVARCCRSSFFSAPSNAERGNPARPYIRIPTIAGDRNAAVWTKRRNLSCVSARPLAGSKAPILSANFMVSACDVTSIGSGSSAIVSIVSSSKTSCRRPTAARHESGAASSRSESVRSSIRGGLDRLDRVDGVSPPKISFLSSCRADDAKTCRPTTSRDAGPRSAGRS